MTNSNLQILNRITEFKSVIENINYTNRDGKTQNVEEGIDQLIKQLILTSQNNNAVYLIGNGGSAGIASHALTDFLNVCQLKAFTLHDPSLITCMANDFGYENSFSHIINTVIRPGDILIAISSSGKSANICNAAKVATEKGGVIITLSGFRDDNPLRKLGDLNFWLNSCDYCMVEIGHQFILHNVADRMGYKIRKNKHDSEKKIRESIITDESP